MESAGCAQRRRLEERRAFRPPVFDWTPRVVKIGCFRVAKSAEEWPQNEGPAKRPRPAGSLKKCGR
jgi:hypothetical protein